MKRFFSKRKRQSFPVDSFEAVFTIIHVGVIYLVDGDLNRLQGRNKQLNSVKWKHGIVQGVVPSQTTYEFGKLDGPIRLMPLEGEPTQPLDESVQIAHELTCGGEFMFMPSYMLQSIQVPEGWYCSVCNKIFLHDMVL